MTKSTKFTSHLIVATLLVSGLSTPAAAEWQADASDKKQAKAAAAITRFKEKVPQLRVSASALEAPMEEDWSLKAVS